MSTKIRVVGLIAAVLLMAACTSDPDPAAGAATAFEAVACPDDVEVLVVPAHECGFVTKIGSATRIFVVTVEPPEASDLSPILETGTDLGMAPGYGGLAPIAQRTGRRVVIVDLPGTGHSLPSLDCPEVDAIGDPAAGNDQSGLAAAVASCRARIEDQGVDPSSFTPVALGADLYDVMTALDVPRWVVMGHGTTAEAGRQVALAHPDHVEALILDSTVLDQRDPAADVDRVVADVAKLCRADRSCRHRYGDPGRAWRKAQAQLRRAPMEIDVAGTTVVIDADSLARGVRWLVAPASLGAARLPAMLAEAASGRPGTYLRLFAATLTAAPPLCVGELPKCETSERLAIGAVLSAQCPSLAEQPEWVDACAAWGVAAAPEPTGRLRGVPALALYGAFDPFASPAVIRKRLAQRLPDAYVVEYPLGAHNVLGSECARTHRNEWLAGDVHRAPSKPACFFEALDFEPV